MLESGLLEFGLLKSGLLKYCPVRRALLIIPIVLGIAPALQAHTPYSTKITWSRDVSRIVYRNCASCHRSGGASFSLMTYRDSRPWAEAFKQQVLERRMPPWNAVKGFGEFKNDHGLTQEDMEVIAEWVNGGAPEGDSALMPPAPEIKTETAVSHSGERQVTLRGTTSLKHSLRAIGVHADQVPDGGLRVVAHKPNGAIEPIIWIEKFSPEDKRTYYFRQPLQLPAGTRIEIAPAESTVALIVK